MDYFLKSLNAEVSNGALDGKKLPKRIKVLSWGKNDTNDGPVFLTDESLKVFEANQVKTGRDKDVAIDFDHCSVPGSKEYVAGQPKSIAGYGDPELIKGDGLYLNNIQWTPRGEEFGRDYKDLSPAAVVNKQGVVLGLDSVALTPHGAVRDLTFYSSIGFDDIIKQMSANKVEKSGLVVADVDDYNKDGANPSLTKTGKEFKLNTKVMNSDDDDDDVDENGIKHSEDCMCARCMDTDDGGSNVETMSAKEISVSKNTNKTKTMSADKDNGTKPRVMPKSYMAIPQQYKSMNDTIIKEMAAIAGVDGETDQEKVLFAFLAAFKGLQTENQDLINKKSNTEEGGLKQFSADFAALRAEVSALKAQKEQADIRYNQTEREMLVQEASKAGKILPLSADDVKSIGIPMLKSIISKLPSGKVPMNSQMRVLNADAKATLTPEEKQAKFLTSVGVK